LGELRHYIAENVICEILKHTQEPKNKNYILLMMMWLKQWTKNS